MPERPERLAGGGEPTTGKKLSKKTSLLILGGVIAIGGIVYLMRKKKAAEEPNVATEPGALTSQAFIPVTGENVGGIGAGGGGYNPGGSQEANSALLEYIKLNNEQAEKREIREHEWKKEQREELGTGGGPPGAQGPAGPPGPEGKTPAPTPPPPSPPVKPPSPSPPPQAKCPDSFPDYNAANGAPGKHSCYKYSRDRCGDSKRPYKHVYWDGHVECSPS